jgi:RNA polymerase sigma-70 factor (ECF subfamily)
VWLVGRPLSGILAMTLPVAGSKPGAGSTSERYFPEQGGRNWPSMKLRMRFTGKLLLRDPDAAFEEPVIKRGQRIHSGTQSRSMTPTELRAEIERLHTAGFAWALVCCGRDRERAEDVLQTSYLKILDGRARFAGRSSFKTYLFGVIRRTASEERRRAAVSGLLLGRYRNEGDRGDRAADDAAPVERLALRSAVETLPRRQREILHLVFSMGMTLQEAAETLSISIGAAARHYHRGKSRLAALLSTRSGA